MTTETVEAPPPGPVRPSLWRHSGFLKLWTGEALSLVGSQVTLVAIPLLAVSILAASTVQMGVLTALGRLPYLLILFVGVWVDSVRRRPLLIGADLGRAAFLLSIPVAYLIGDLGLPWLFVVMFCVGVLTVIFDISWSAYLPTLVDRADLAEGNSKLALATSVADVVGPGIAAALLRFFSAAIIVFVDVASYLASALLIFSIHKPETKPVAATGNRPRVLASIRQGLSLVWNEPLMRPTLIASSFFMFFVPGIQTLYFLYAYRQLGVSASFIALILMLAGPGAILGSALGPRIIKRIGLGRMCVIAALGGNTSFLLVPLATRPEWLAIVMLGAAQLIYGFTMPLGGISTVTIRQAVTPDDMQGRVTATFRAFGLGLAPFGALAAGFIGTYLGDRLTIFIFAIGVTVPIIFLFRSPLPKLGDVDDIENFVASRPART